MCAVSPTRVSIGSTKLWLFEPAYVSFSAAQIRGILGLGEASSAKSTEKSGGKGQSTVETAKAQEVELPLLQAGSKPCHLVPSSDQRGEDQAYR